MGFSGHLRKFYGRRGRNGPTSYYAEIAEAGLTTRGTTEDAALQVMREAILIRLSFHLRTDVAPHDVRIVRQDTGRFEVDAPGLLTLRERSPRGFG